VKKCGLLFALVFVCSTLSAEPSLEPSVSLSFEPESRLNSTRIIEAALEYSLCPLSSERGQECMKKYKSLESACAGLKRLPQAERAEAVLTLLYKNLLVQYSANQYLIDGALQSGRYNCVTSAILYLALAKSVGLDVRGVETTIHAYCNVYIDGQCVRVECTNPYGYNPGVKKETSQTQNSRTFTYVTKKHYSGSREDSDLAFATLTGKNLVSDLNETDQYEKAVPVAVSRLLLLQAVNDREAAVARSDLDTLCTNYSITENRKLNHLASAEYMEKVAAKFGWNDSLRKTYSNGVYNQVNTLLNNNRVEEAQSILQKKSGNMLPSMAKNCESNIFRSREVNYHNKIATLFNNGDWEGALKIAEEAVKEFPSSKTLQNDLRRLKK
jgi:tetratricopeptide (TPR) repeat protein